ncbi:secreted RxLR effector protein 161-like [Lathyrus oleraceus]|uniref:secreted RxLR effector protein 161-like n=1 Tax=Pisum sativum TaxID=3888 RepID=UPI0021D3C188|nr:secreted RxLR effector protein 161-like [Pisum sativum]
MEHCNVAITPVEPRLHLSNNEDEKDVDPTQYIRLIGSLHYLCNTRSDLAFSVSIVSRFTGIPKVSHLTTFKRILRYVKGFVGRRILFLAADMDIKWNFLGFTDFNWWGDKDDRKSTTGYIFMFGGTPISWCSMKELVVALSSCEVKYIVALLCACQAMWVMNILKELGSSDGEAVTLLVDNVFAINLSKNPIVMGGASILRRGFNS